MTDREKVISEFEDFVKSFSKRDDTYYKGLFVSVLALLKEQEAKKVIKSTNMYTGLPITHCPKCGVSIDRYLYGRQHEGQINYCPICGQAVKRE